MKNSKMAMLFMMVVAMCLVSCPSVWGAATCFHGISLQKNAVSPVQEGDPAGASYLIVNVDLAGDTLDVCSIGDTIFASGGNVSSGDLLHTLTWHFTGGAFFVVGGASNGQLRMPPGATAMSDPFSFYTTVLADFFLPGHILPDQAAIRWHDTCDNEANSLCTNCATDVNNLATAPSQTQITAQLPCVSVTKTADCDIATVGKLITYTITITNCGPNPLTKVSVIDSLLGPLSGCDSIAVDANCIITTTRTIQAGDPSPLVNTVQVNYIDDFNQTADANASATVVIAEPNFTVTKTCAVDPIPSGGPATFTVVVKNTGDLDLQFTTDEEANSSLAEPFTVAAGATQNLTITIPATGTSDVLNTITVTATVVGDPNCVEFTDGNQKTAQDTCHGAGLATRTWGFWKTHTAFTECVFKKCGSSFDLGWRQVTTNAELFGIFFANNAKNSNGTSRNALCQARVTASKQALAALLNTCLANGEPLPAGITPASIANTLKNGTVAQIIALNNILDAFNNSGDTVALGAGETCVQGSATPKASLDVADIPFADCP